MAVIVNVVFSAYFIDGHSNHLIPSAAELRLMPRGLYGDKLAFILIGPDLKQCLPSSSMHIT